MPSTRLIRSLSSFPSSSAPRASTSLAPPYAHEAPAPGSSLVPPYSHTVKPPASSTSLSPHHRFSLRQRTTTPPALSTALRSLLSTPDGRRRLTELWVQSIDGIERTRSTGVQIPQVSFITLGQHLGDESFVQTIKDTGVVVVRDVVRDEDVAGWAKQLGKALEERQGRLTFWDKSLLAARSDPSILSSNNQILSALTGVESDAYILAAAAREGLDDRTSTLAGKIDAPWDLEADVESSTVHVTPLTSHLALTRPLTISPTLTPSIHAAIYATLRPLFTATRSLISFYHSSAYLDPANWQVVDNPTSAEVPPQTGALDERSFPHLSGSMVPIPSLEPGDILYSHSSLPIINSSASCTDASPASTSTSAPAPQIFLPLSPLPPAQNTEYILHQREAFERGLPPPGGEGDGLVELEVEGERRDIKSRGGRSAMGYD